MPSTLERQAMPRRKDAPPRTNDVPVKMDREVVRKSKIAAAYKGQSLAEYLSETVGAIVDQHIEEAHAKERQTAKGGKPKGRGEKS